MHITEVLAFLTLLQIVEESRTHLFTAPEIMEKKLYCKQYVSQSN
jgi:hypothetical protein